MEALLILQIIIVIMLIVVILMQRSNSDGFTGGGSSSMGGLMTGRGQANLMTKTTAILATIFIVNSLILAYIASHTQREKSVIDNIIASEETTNDVQSKTVINEDTKEEKEPVVPLSE